jgi:hypothetical protein
MGVFYFAKRPVYRVIYHLLARIDGFSWTSGICRLTRFYSKKTAC